MKKLICLGLFIILLTGCAGPQYSGNPIEKIDTSHLVIINNKDTKPGFQKTMETWLDGHGYTYEVLPNGSEFDLDKINLEYKGVWRWDLAIFLSEAYINAYYKGQRIGEVSYIAKNNLNTNKYSDAETRINYLMDLMFGKVTVNEANKMIIPKTE